MSAETATIIGWVLVLADLAIRIAALIIIPRDRKPTAAMAWLLAIFLIPFVGILLFLLIGSPKLPKARRERQKEINRMIADRSDRLDLPDGRAEWPAWFASVVEQNRKLGALPAIGGNSARLIGDYRGVDRRDGRGHRHGDAVRARRVLHRRPRRHDEGVLRRDGACGAARRRGAPAARLRRVQARRPSHAATIAELDRIGVKWSYMLAVQPTKGKYQRPDLRNHRKLVVVDGLVGFTGSQNLIDRSYDSEKNLKRGLQWQELVTRVTGPTVTAINAVFLSDWYSETDELLGDEENVPVAAVPADHSPDALVCQVVPSGPAYEGENNLRLFLSLVYGRPGEGHHHEPVLRARRGDDVRHHVGEASAASTCSCSSPRSATRARCGTPSARTTVPC